MRLLFVTPTLSENSLGRTYALWLLARHLGWSSEVVSLKGSRIWEPVRGTEFAEACRLLSGSRAETRSALDAAVRMADAVIAVKPYDESLGAAAQAASAAAVPLLLDVDDPDYETRFTWARKRGILKRVLLRDERARSLRRARKCVGGASVIVSNPVLQSIYGGDVVPHARAIPDQVELHTRTAPVIAFVGTPKAHKGIEMLRSAVARLAENGYRLVVTGDAPADAQPWETWTGALPFDEAMDVLASSDIVALPSPEGSWSRGQLPAKLMDAMAFGRAIVVSDVGPLRWAVGDGALVVPADSTDSLVGALLRLGSPDVRAELGARARMRAASTFSLDAVSLVFEEAVRGAQVPRLS